MIDMNQSMNPQMYGWMVGCTDKQTDRWEKVMKKEEKFQNCTCTGISGRISFRRPRMWSVVIDWAEPSTEIKCKKVFLDYAKSILFLHYFSDYFTSMLLYLLDTKLCCCTGSWVIVHSIWWILQQWFHSIMSTFAYLKTCSLWITTGS